MSTSTSSHTILITVKQAGFQEVNAAVNGFAKSSQTASKSATTLGTSWNKASTGASKFGKETTTLGKGFTLLGKNATTAGKSTGTYTTAAGKASTTTDKLSKGIGAGGRGLAFGFIGLGSAIAEAAGMFGMYQAASDKVADAQTKVNNLQQQGVTSGTAYTRATNDLADAQRGLQFILRNTILSFTDIATFVLLAVNAIANMRSISQSAATSTQALTTATQALAAAQTASSVATEGAGAAVTAYRTTIDAAAAGVEQFGTSFGTLGTRLTDTNGAIQTLGTSTSTLNTVYAEGLTAVDNLYTSQGQLVTSVTDLATETDTFNPILQNMDDIMLKNDKTVKASRVSFAGLATGIKALPGIFKEIGSAVLSFFTNFGSNISKMGSWLMTAGTAVADFGKKMLIAFVTNPIGLIIVGIASAVLALATNFGGARDAVNSAGVAVGKAIPPLEGILKAIGGAANAGLDWIASQLGMEQQANRTTTALEKQAKVALEGATKHVSLARAFNTMRADLDLVTSSVYDGTIKQDDLSNSIARVNLMVNDLAKEYPELADEIRLYLNEADKAGLAGKDYNIIINELIDHLTALEDKYDDTQQATYDKRIEDMAAAEAAKEHALTQQTLSQASADVTGYISTQKDEMGNLKIAYAESVKSVGDFLIAQNDEILTTKTLSKEQQNWIGDLQQIAPALDTYRKLIVKGSDGHIDYRKTLDAIIASEQDLEKQVTSTWTIMEDVIKTKGVAGLKEVEIAIKFAEDAGVKGAENLRAKFEKFKEEIKDDAKYADFFKDKLEEVTDTTLKYYADQVKALDEKRAAQEAEAKWLGIWDEIAAKTTKTRQTIIDYDRQEQEAIDAVVSSMQTMAMARGMEYKDLTNNTGTLLKYIQTHDLLPPTIAEENEALANLIDSRQQEAQAAELEERALRALISTMDTSIDTTGMTVDGLGDLVTILDETANAEQIATDSVTLWYAELQKSQAVEAAERELLLKFAQDHQVTIPEAIRTGSIAAMKEYIAEAMGMGATTEEIAQRATDAFNEMAQKGSDALGNMIDESILEEDAAEIEDILDEIGLEADSVFAKARVMELSVDDTDFKNKVTGLPEILITEFEKIAGYSKEQATEAVTIYADQLEEDFGGRMPGIGDAVNLVWEYIQATATPGETADELLLRFEDEVKNNKGLLQSAFDGTIVQTIKDLKAPVGTEGTVIGNEATNSVATGMASGKTQIQNATLGYIVDPYTGEISKMPGTTETELQPIPGIFSQAFLDASNQGGAQLAAMVTLVHTKMQSMSLSIDTYSTSMSTNLAAFVDASVKKLPELDKATVTTHEAFSTLSTSVDTYMDSMTKNTNDWANQTSKAMGAVDDSRTTTQDGLSNMSTSVATYMESMSTHVEDFASACETAFEKTGQSADDAREKVEALQKAIDALKDKTVTITYKQVTTGSKPSAAAQHGGAWIQNEPTRIGGTRVAETYPEAIVVTPLDPREPNSPFHNLNVPMAAPQIPSISGITTTASSNQQPVTVTGDLYVTVQTQNGETLANAVKPFLLKGFGGIT